MPSLRDKSHRLRWLGLIVACGLMLAMLAAGVRWHRVWLAHRLQDHMADASDYEVAARVEQLAGLDEAGLSALVESLYHERRTVRDAAKRVLDSKLDNWRNLPTEWSVPQIMKLAKLLAEHARDASPETLRASSDLALQILAWTSDGNSSGAGAWTFWCEQVLVAARRAGVIAQSDEAAEFIEIANTPLAPKTGDQGSLGVPPQWPPQASPSEMPREDVQVPIARNRGNSTPPPRELITSPAANLIALTDSELIYRVSDPTDGNSAENELRRRGFSSLDVRVARVASDADVGRREELARTLPQLGGVDTRSWLLFLLHDKSPRVRAVAARWLATSGDAGLHEHLRELAQSETDETVRQALRSMDATQRE